MLIESFEINGFRRYNHFKFDNLNRINIFLGNNNTGKTTILESIFAFACGENISAILPNSILRSKQMNSPYDFAERFLGAIHNTNEKPFTFEFSASIKNSYPKKTFKHSVYPHQIFSNFKPNLFGAQTQNYDQNISMQNFQNNPLFTNIPIQLIPMGEWEVTVDGNKKPRVELSFPPISQQLVKDPFKQGKYVDILSHRDQQENTKIYSQLKREGLMNEFITEIRNVFPSVIGIDSIPYPDGTPSPILIQTDNGELLPIYNFGDGLQRWFHILGGMLLYRKSIHCLEELDVTFHPNAQKDFALNLYNYSKKYDNQLFITSHSIEFIDNFLDSIYENEALYNEEDILRIITLKNDPNTNEVRTRTLTGKEAHEKREKYKLELR